MALRIFLLLLSFFPVSPAQRAVRAISFSDAGRRLAAATSGGKICEWNFQNRSLVRQLQDSDELIASASIGATRP